MALLPENSPDFQKPRFFVALLPPAEIQTYAEHVIQDLTQRYRTRTSQAPPHITLQPPFLWTAERLAELTTTLQDFANGQGAVPVRLSNFGSFAPRVLYLNVVKTPELLILQTKLSRCLVDAGIIDSSEQEQRPYVPHLTVASRQMTRKIFQQAWAELQPQTVEFQFRANQLTLLIYIQQRWQVQANFDLGER